MRRSPAIGTRTGRGLSVMLTVAVLAPLTGACATPVEESMEEPTVQRIASAPFGTLPDGRAVTAYTLRNEAGMEVVAIDYGAIITQLWVPDASGVVADVALGFDDLDGYLAGSPYFGAIVGRYGNRIAGGRFTLDGREYELATNNGPNHLHGGDVGFDKVLWDAEAFELDATDGGGPAGALRLTYVSIDGEEGYPGTLTTQVTYSLRDDNALAIDYVLTTDAPTPANTTQHTYFNLAGSGDVLGHTLWLGGDRYTPVDETLIPTGELARVLDTPFDFTAPTAIGDRIEADHEQLRFGGGYDHNWVLNRDPGADRALIHAARVHDPVSGRVLQVYTTEPGIQFYSGNFLDGTLTGKNGVTYGHRSGFCLETQHFPDSPNQPGFPTTIVRPGQTYSSRTEFRFSAE